MRSRSLSRSRSRGRKNSGSLEMVGAVLVVGGAGVETEREGAAQECGRRKEREWSGEWNRGDMEEVVRALRGLRS